MSSIFLALATAACGDTSTVAVPESADAGADAAAQGGDGGPRVVVHAVVDLPRRGDTEALSATAFDPATRTLFALKDDRARIVPLVASEDFTAFVPGTPIALTGRTSTEWDGEGLALLDRTFYAVSDETAPHIERFDLAGDLLGEVEVPERFARQAPNNKGLESLAISPSGRFLFFASESALVTDGSAATRTRGTTVRLFRRDLASGAEREVAYRTEPLGDGTGGDMGVSEIAALSDDALLILERGFQTDHGNTVRIYEVDLASAADVSGRAALDDDAPVVDKTLLVNLGELPPSGATHPSVQPNPLLDNYEALSLGPTRDDGRRLLFVTSDDNRNRDGQVARVLVLAVRDL